jgi:hypothetical protein
MLKDSLNAQQNICKERKELVIAEAETIGYKHNHVYDGKVNNKLSVFKSSHLLLISLAW